MYKIILLAVIVLIILPAMLYRHFTNLAWRKRAKIGDRCFFINSMDYRTYGVVNRISNDRSRVYVITDPKPHGNSQAWHPMTKLRII